MQNTSQIYRLGVIGALAALSGCQVIAYHPPDPLTTTEIIEMSVAGRSAAEIIGEIEASQTIYEMDSEDVLDLHEKGVAREVIDHMLKTEERELRRRYYNPHHHYPYGHYYSPHPYSYWGWCW